jgi:hypothetical protein
MQTSFSGDDVSALNGPVSAWRNANETLGGAVSNATQGRGPEGDTVAGKVPESVSGLWQAVESRGVVTWPHLAAALRRASASTSTRVPPSAKGI